MGSEKRSFSRVETRLKAYARKTRSPETPSRFNATPVLAAYNRDELMRNAKLPDALITFLCELDKKADQIISLLSQDQIRSEFPLSLEVVELSGAGAKFSCSEALSEKDFLEIILVLNNFPLKISSTKARIVDKKDNSGFYRMEYVNIRESDMEAIIQYVFQRQREIIRNSKRT